MTSSNTTNPLSNFAPVSPSLTGKTTMPTQTITLIRRPGRVQYLPGCAIAKAFILGRMRKFITLHDVKALELLGFTINYIDNDQIKQ